MWQLILVSLLFLISLIGLARADVYVVTDQNNAVYSLSSQNDAVIPPGYTLTVLKGKDMSTLPITGDPAMYNFNGGGFTLNTTKVQTAQAAQQAVIADKTARDNARASAIAKLTDAITKVAPQDVLTDQELNAVMPQ